MSLHHPDTALVTSLVEDAVTAPSMHNAQPWRFLHHAGGDTVEIYGDPGRTMPRGDPRLRALHLGVGAAVFSLRVGAAWRGWSTSVRLLPDRENPWFLAEVTLRRATDPGEPDGLALLRPALRRRHTSRHPFSEERVPGPVLDRLRSAALLEGAQLLVPGPWHTDILRDLVRDAELSEAMDAGLRAEIAGWTRVRDREEDGPSDGIPSYALGPRQHGVSAPVREFDPTGRIPGRPAASFEERPQIVILGTGDDRPADWLRAGQALQRVLLQATLDGLATSPISQPLEWPDLRETARAPHSEMGYVHMLVRLGYGPAGAPTGRRPVAEVLEFV
ncbi:Acg family FMN-binding oxidoreductase [Streptomyces sp. NPDC005017]|uniref:Acg family FMN-binding oxidoreductase n=1 Tax=Streptomyces sp. NPDC005017 TaxID=3364706 RepID=UPI00367BD449